MGFCLFNNVAVGAAHAHRGLRRRAGPGARLGRPPRQRHRGDLRRVRADVLYASIHQSPLYPGTGAAGDSGSGPGRGATPQPAGAAGGGRRTSSSAWSSTWSRPVARAYEPGPDLVSAGYDAHRDDPLADCLVNTADYGAMSAHVRELGRELGAPILVCLEGGYDPGALAGSTLATALALQAGGSPEPTAPVALVAEAAARVAGLDRWRSAF